MSSAVTSADSMRTTYLNLLIAQLRNQDPLAPMDNNQMAGQLAQLSQLEELVNMNGTFEQVLDSQQQLQAAALIGREVSFVPEDATEAVAAIVEAVDMVDGKAMLRAATYEPDPENPGKYVKTNQYSVDLAKVQSIA